MKLYQSFSIPAERLENHYVRECIRRVGPRWGEFLNQLKQRGYTVLVGMNTIGRVHTSIILGFDMETGAGRLDPKGDFYAFANESKLPFESGEAHRDMESSSVGGV